MKVDAIYRKESWISKMLNKKPMITQLVKGLKQNWHLDLCSPTELLSIMTSFLEMRINTGKFTDELF